MDTSSGVAIFSPRFKAVALIIGFLSFATVKSVALDACKVLSAAAISAALHSPDLSAWRSTEDTPHRSTCGYKSSQGMLLAVIISDDPAAYDEARQKKPAGNVTEIAIPDLGNRALLWDSRDGVQAMASTGVKFARVGIMHQAGVDSAAAQKMVADFVGEALAADWNPAPGRAFLKDPAVPIHKVPPAYPPLARSARVQGPVVLQALIGKDGTVQTLEVLSGHPMLVPAAMDAVKQWTYKPYLVNGQPVEVETEVHIEFTLSGKAADTSAGSPSANSSK